MPCNTSKFWILKGIIINSEKQLAACFMYTFLKAPQIFKEENNLQ